MANDPNAIRIDLAERLRYFDPDGTLGDDTRIAAKLIEGCEKEINDAFWDHYQRCKGSLPAHGADMEALRQRGVDYIRAKGNDATGQHWVDLARDHARMTYKFGDPVALVLSCFEVANRMTVRFVRQKVGDDADAFKRASSGVFRTSVIEADVIFATIAALRERDVERERHSRADVFPRTHRGRTDQRVRSRHAAARAGDRGVDRDARDARQGKRSRRRRRTIGGRDARCRAHGSRPDPRDRGSARRGRGRGRHCDARVGSGGECGGGQRNARRHRQIDRIDPRADPRRGGADQSASAQRDDRSGARGRCRAGFCGRRTGSEIARQPDRARDRRHRRQRSPRSRPRPARPSRPTRRSARR